MNAIKKTLNYFVTYASATVLIYSLFRIGIYFYLPNPSSLMPPSDILAHFYLPIIYSLLTVVILTISQFGLLKPSKGQETMIYGCFNLVFFVMGLALGIIMAVKAGTNNAPLLGVMSGPVLALALIEISYSIVLLVRHSHEPKEEIVVETKDENPQK